jgi:outer membrane protein
MTARVRRVLRVRRPAVAAVLCWTLGLPGAWGQSPAIEPEKAQGPIWWRPYLTPQVPPVRLDNSSWMRGLIRAGNLYLTVQDAIALVLENNIDVEVARYDPISAVWRVQRAEAGEGSSSPLTASSLVGSVAPGQGVLGSETSAGATPTQNSSTTVSRGSNATSSASTSSLGQNLDPVFQEATVFSHTSEPVYDTLLSLTPVLVSNMSASTGRLQQGLLSGGSVTLTYSDHYLNENAITDLLNPSVAPNLSVSIQHNLLRGFGVAVNARNIKVAKIKVQVSDLSLKLQVISAVAGTLESYYTLVANYDNVKVKQSSLEVAQTLYEDNKKQEQTGTLTALDVTSAEAQLAINQRDLLIAETSLHQQETQLKNLLSRTGSADPVLRDVRIIPIDHIVIPSADDLPPLETMLQQALANRADLAIEKADLAAAEVSALGSKNALLPVLQVSGSESDAGLAGTRRTVTIGKVSETVDPYFGGGTGTALGQVFRRDFPADRIGASFQAPVFNRQAQADYALDQLSLRQDQLANQKDINQVHVELIDSVMKLEQARARYQFSVKYKILQKQLLDTEQESYSVGKSTAYNVMQEQRDFAAAQDAEIASMIALNSAVIALEVARGITLETNHVSIDEVKAGRVKRSATAGN